MANRFIVGVSLSVAAFLVAGCEGPEHKLGRGLANATEFAHMSEWQKSVEEESIFAESPSIGFHTGAVIGFDNSVKRTGMGIYEILTFPFPPYHPVLTKYVPAKAGYPDSYIPGHIADSAFDTDQYSGFSGGEVAPFIPGSKFTVYGN